MNPREQFIGQLTRLKRGSITRRHFLGTTGLGAAVAVMVAAMPELAGIRTAAAGDIGAKVTLATWPNYYDPRNLEKFTQATGAAVDLCLFNSNEDMLAALQAGGTGWDVLVPTNYMIADYAARGLIEPLDLKKLPNYDIASQKARLISDGMTKDAVYGAGKDWGTTGFAVNTRLVADRPQSWREFWDLARTKCSGHSTVQDYQLTAVGNALKYFGYSFNSVEPKQLADAEKLLLDAKPHLFAITGDDQPAFRSTDAWIGMCGVTDAKPLHKELPEIAYVLGKEGGQIWTDFYSVPKSPPNRNGGYALINFLLDPAVNAAEVSFHGQPSTDGRTDKLLPKAILDDPLTYPAAELLEPLEFATAVAMLNKERAEIMARFSAA